MAEFGAGAKYRKTLPPSKRPKAVMKSFEKGELHSGSGEIVKDPKQAKAIAISESKADSFWEKMNYCRKKLGIK